jgi:nucleotide-binding universal stress UspA family protein
MPAEQWPDGPVILGVDWNFSEHLIRTAEALAAALKVHLICAFVDPASYLTEWAPVNQRTALSLDPSINEEAEFPSGHLQRRLEDVLGEPGESWSFRVLNGGVAKALNRLARNTGATMLVVGTGRPGPLARVDRVLAGSVPAALLHQQQRPVLIVPEG